MESFEEGAEIVRVYLAGAVAEAQAVEQALDAAGVDYGVEVETYPAAGLLGSAGRTGVGIWVLEAELDRSADALERAGHLSGLVDRSGG
jgi:hypothetical protein